MAVVTCAIPPFRIVTKGVLSHSDNGGRRVIHNCPEPDIWIATPRYRHNSSYQDKQHQKDNHPQNQHAEIASDLLAQLRRELNARGTENSASGGTRGIIGGGRHIGTIEDSMEPKDRADDRRCPQMTGFQRYLHISLHVSFCCRLIGMTSARDGFS